MNGDAGLVERIQSGDRAAECELIDRYSLAVWAILSRWRPRGAIAAEDLYQDTWHVVITKIREGKTNKPNSIDAFIAQTARFTLNGAYRKERIRQHDRLASDGRNEVADRTPDAWVAIDARFRARITRQFLATLGRDRRDLLFMYFVSEYTREEIMQALDITGPQLSRRLHSARAVFRKFIQERMPELEPCDD